MTNPVIVGIDLSLTATGICCDDNCCTTIEPKTVGMARLNDIRGALEHHMMADLVMLEGYSYASRHSHAHALGELGGLIRWSLWKSHIPYVDIPPSTLKKFATGKGNASKDQMVASAARLGCPADNNNAVDAWWLRQLGVYALYVPITDYCPVPATGYRNEIVAAIDWPMVNGPKAGR
jgi:Holliday junction resolvasome RuvABC endonuclease subunit